MSRTLVLIIFTLSFSLTAWAFKVDEIIIDCGKSSQCEKKKKEILNINRRFQGKSHLRDTMKLYLRSGGFNNFTYLLVKEDKKNLLKI